MKVLKLYEYANCSTCKKAFKFLVNRRFAVERVDIFQNPPSKAELAQMLKFQEGNIRKLFNTMGHVYQESGLKDKLPQMSEKEALDLLASNGRLIKRPFLLLEKTGLVGFHASEWEKALL